MARMAVDAFCPCVCVCVIIYYKFVTTIPYKLLVGISFFDKFCAVGDKCELIRL